MKQYFFNQALLPDGWHTNVTVNVDNDGYIDAIDKNSKPAGGSTIIDCVIPAMPNCHSHVFQRSMAGLTEYKTAENDSFWSWRDLMYKYANQINPDALYDIAKYTYSEMLQVGYSSVCEFHYIHRHLDDKNDIDSMSLTIIEAAHDVGMPLTLLPVLYTQAHIDGTELSKLQKRFKLSCQEYIELYTKLQEHLYQDQNLGLCFHSLRAVSQSQIQSVIAALDNQQPIHIHISEQMAEVEQIYQHTGKRPVEWLFDHFNVDERWCLIHATHLNKNEIEMITDAKAIAGLCPMTEANLGDGIFPLQSYIQNKGSFAIGSDSHVLINPFQEMQILEYSQRLQHQQRVIASTAEQAHVGTFLWNQAVQSGAKACQLPVSGLQTGQYANWLSLDTSHPLLTKLDGKACLDSSIFAHNNTNIEVYQKGQLLTGMQKSTIQNYKNTLNSLR